MKQYHDLLKLVLEGGKVKHNRTGVDTIGVFGAQARFNLAEGFPLLTTKKVFFKGIVHELLWFLSGSTNIKYLVDNDVHIWDEWAYKKYTNWCDANLPRTIKLTQQEFIQKIKNGEAPYISFADLGEGTYGGMWRAFPYAEYWEIPRGASYSGSRTGHNLSHVDQIQKVIDKLKTNPDDRRMIVSAWHPYWVDHCALPPCHVLFHFNTEELTETERVSILSNSKRHLYPTIAHVAPADLDMHNIPKRRLNCLLYQRSCDLFLGVPFNIASYSLLLAMVAQVTNMVPGEFIHTYGDLHIYTNHLDQVKLQLSREPKALPSLVLNPNIKNINDFKFEDITIKDYNPYAAIKAVVAV